MKFVAIVQGCLDGSAVVATLLSPESSRLPVSLIPSERPLHAGPVTEITMYDAVENVHFVDD